MNYQSKEALCALVQDHFAILKVGQHLTFAMREALFALNHIEETLHARTICRIIAFHAQGGGTCTNTTRALAGILHRRGSTDRLCHTL